MTVPVIVINIWIYVTNPDKPCPGNMQQREWAILRCFREEEEKTRDARKNLFVYESRFCLLTILKDSQVSKAYVLKQQFLILFLASPCSAHALHLSLGLIQIIRSAPTNCSNYTLIFRWIWEALYMDVRVVAVLY